MKNFDFDTLIPRRGTNSYKWDTPEDESVLPMWVADMDFQTAPAIIEALRKRVAHGIFGYTKVPDAYYRHCNPGSNAVMDGKSSLNGSSTLPESSLPSRPSSKP